MEHSLKTSDKHLSIPTDGVPHLNSIKCSGLEFIHFAKRLKDGNLFKYVTSGIVGIIGAAIILSLTYRYGAGLTPDSAAYLSAASNLAEDNGFLTYNGLHLVIQPPLYSIILAVIKKTTLVDPRIAAGYLNAVLFGFIIYLSGLLLLRYLNSFALVFLGIVSVLLSYTLIQASFMVLSELLFIFLVLLFLYYFGKYQMKGDFISLFLFSASASLACLTRYTGVIMIAAGILSVVFWSKNSNKEKFWHSVIFLLITVLPISLWIIRNYFISGTLVGLRASSSYTLFENFSFLYKTVLPWYLPLNLTGISFILILLLPVIWIFFKSSGHISWNGDGIKLIGPSLLFVLLYAGIILISSTTTAYDRISDRLLSPIYIPMLFILFFIAERVLIWLREKTHLKSITLFVVIGIVLLMSFPVKKTIRVTEQFILQAGWGFSSQEWRENRTIKYLNQHKHLGKSYTLYSNEPEAVYILTCLTTKCSPPKRFYNSPQLFDITGNPKESWRKGEDVCLVWLTNSTRSYLFSIDELQKHISMTKIASLKDGKIYTFLIK
ncbi:MAG: hypothetical protein COZ80_09790 [Ignavibacteria bacterium CG_4_8_14_3_um_filter_37_9]|nr:MAG: hypothetical protein COZ80_09790 [Ignavibacteria bacterium CG_4_8_14_3_um_filter_37_9]PIX94438.1 MAG: hypothetical protein COZ25_05635 [Ignavibacteria bacterium CG_4_10_14_3_um_filter_37_18]PJC57593.1 MAG: hypothetical protein CO025_12585 [Ignavibacteria bacterium CG_4_9_14_0_2_um_filter_37_13]